ncbi:MAG: ParA family protein, partial [Spirulinaceae cyanobacterium]
LTRSGILASDFYLVPAKPEPLSVIGVGILEGRIQQLKKSDRTQIDLIGILFNSRGHATKMAPKIKKRLGAEFGEDKLFTTEIPVNVAVAQAVDEFKPVVLSDPQSSGAKAFSSLTQEFLQRVGAMVKA